MKICENCGSAFPVKLVVGGMKRNLQRRKYCLVCSPFGKRNTRKLVGEDKRKSPKRRRMSDKERRRRKVIAVCEWRRRTKKRAVEFLGGACSICGYSRCCSALEFHHKDRKGKLFSISRASKSWEKLKVELIKCVLVCANCHREVEEGLVSF